MATYHLNIKTVSKNKGQSAKAKFDYISRQDKYKNKVGFQYIESNNMPSFAKDNPNLFWQSADNYERANARVCREIKIALPREFNLEQQKLVIKDFAEKMLPNIPYTFAIHNDKENHNPHCHLIFSDRKISPYSMNLSPEKFFKRSSTDKKGKKTGGAEKDRNLIQKDFVSGENGLRKMWTKIANEHLANNGFNISIDDRTYKEQGISKEAKSRINRIDFLEQKNLEKIEQELTKQRQLLKQQEEQARLRAEQEKLLEQARIQAEQEKLRKQQEEQVRLQAEQKRLEQQKAEERRKELYLPQELKNEFLTHKETFKKQLYDTFNYRLLPNQTIRNNHFDRDIYEEIIITHGRYGRNFNKTEAFEGSTLYKMNKHLHDINQSIYQHIYNTEAIPQANKNIYSKTLGTTGVSLLYKKPEYVLNNETFIENFKVSNQFFCRRRTGQCDGFALYNSVQTALYYNYDQIFDEVFTLKPNTFTFLLLNFVERLVSAFREGFSQGIKEGFNVITDETPDTYYNNERLDLESNKFRNPHALRVR